jgi:diguanylate cyclase
MPELPDRCSVLLLDDEPAILNVLARQLDTEFDVRTARTPGEARAALARNAADIVIADLHLSEGTGLTFLEWVRGAHPRCARMLLTGTARLEDAVAAVNCCHIHRLVIKPWRPEDLLASLRSLADSIQLERRHAALLEEYRGLTLELEERVRERTAEVESRSRDLQNALAEIEHKNQILEKMALTDALTGLPNRRAVDLIARKELLRRTRVASPIAIGLIDADHFKDVNSSYLLSGGDFVLQWLGRTLHGSIRAADSLGRVGGEEFMVVAPDTDRSGADALAERLRTTVERYPAIYQGQAIRVTVSVGMAVADPHSAAGYDEMRETAAAALAEAKARGRNRCVIKQSSGVATPRPVVQ